jgi:hypothetical protein
MISQDREDYAGEIVNALHAITSASMIDNRNSTWTRRIKEDIGQLGKNHNFDVCTSGCEGKFEGEWLYDLIWYKNNNNNRLETVPLVLESEWSMDDFQIRFDFEKLLVANSPLKVMIFQNCDDTSEKVFQALREGIDEYIHGANCTYILACYQWKHKKFETRTFKKAPSNEAQLMTLPS